MLLKLGTAVAIVAYAAFFTAALFLWSIEEHAAKVRGDSGEHPRFIGVMPPYRDHKADRAPRGGGGGGDESLTPPSRGQYSPASLDNSIIAPTTAPQDRVVSLPVLETVFVDPRLEPPRHDLLPTGLPDGIEGPPSDGPGTEGGIGSGNKGGIGPGNGNGAGPGDDGGIGGGSNRPGLGKISRADEVDSQPVLLNHIRPSYTEEARRHRVQGVVKARILITADGSVRRVVLQSHLPDGLDEEAIRAALSLRFVPAKKSGAAVPVWIPLNIEFSLR
jgi:TonB family protein